MYKEICEAAAAAEGGPQHSWLIYVVVVKKAGTVIAYLLDIFVSKGNSVKR